MYQDIDAPDINAVPVTQQDMDTFCEARNMLDEDEELRDLVMLTLRNDLMAEAAMAKIRQEKIKVAVDNLDRIRSVNAPFRSLGYVDPFIAHAFKQQYGHDLWDDPKDWDSFVKNTPCLQRPFLEKKQVFNGIGYGKFASIPDSWVVENQPTKTSTATIVDKNGRAA